MNIAKTLKSYCEMNRQLPSFTLGFGGVYIEDVNLFAQKWSGDDSYSFTGLENALRRGAECPIYRITCSFFERDNLVVTNYLDQTFGFDLAKIWAFLEGLSFSKDKWGYEEPLVIGSYGGCEISCIRRTESGMRVFSPFALDRLSPLKESPKKWTLSHVYRALANGQFKSLRCNGVYTDDYAYDAGVNYRQGEINSPLDFLRRIMGSPSGWWCSNYDNGDSVRICCHHFDSNEFTFCLVPPKKEKAPVVPLQKKAA